MLQSLNFFLSLAVITGLFAMMFKVLPDAHIAWKDVWIGAALTALLFTVGKFAIGFYLGKSDVGSAYGAAGSLVILLLWVYYSAQILLFGAEFTQVYANHVGSRIIPHEEAIAVDPRKAAGDSSDGGKRLRSEPPNPADLPVMSRKPTAQTRAPEGPFQKEMRWLGVGLLVLSIITLLREQPTGDSR